jgi:hypothetical protein
VLRGGLAGVRQAVDEQNAQARAAGGPEIRSEAILSLAEELLPSLRAAEWHDRAEAAAASVDEISLRDLRTVVAGADGAGRDEESRALATQLREGLERRAASERQTWVDEITTCLAEGRVVRALRVSSRAPEQGLRLPPELSTGLSQAAGEAMSADTAADRWLAVLEAVLTSPVRRTIVPKGLPAGADEDTLKTMRQAISKVPALGPLLGESPATRPVPPPPQRRPPAPPSPGAGAAAPVGAPGSEPAMPPAQPEPVASAAPPARAEPEPPAVEPVAVAEREPAEPAPQAVEPVAVAEPAPQAVEPVAVAEREPAEPARPAAEEPQPVEPVAAADRPAAEPREVSAMEPIMPSAPADPDPAAPAQPRPEPVRLPDPVAVVEPESAHLPARPESDGEPELRTPSEPPG